MRARSFVSLAHRTRRERIAELEAAVATSARQFGAEHPATLQARVRLALAYREHERYEDGLAELERVAAIYDDLTGDQCKVSWRPRPGGSPNVFLLQVVPPKINPDVGVVWLRHLYLTDEFGVDTPDGTMSMSDWIEKSRIEYVGWEPDEHDVVVFSRAEVTATKPTDLTHATDEPQPVHALIDPSLLSAANAPAAEKPAAKATTKATAKKAAAAKAPATKAPAKKAASTTATKTTATTAAVKRTTKAPR